MGSKSFTALGLALLALAPGWMVPLWAPVNIQPDKPTRRDVRKFDAITVWPNQRTRGPINYTYVKGTRSENGNHPRRWYVRQDGHRLRDRESHLWVMNPYNRGWRQRVARECPRRCFVDGIGGTSMKRAGLRWSWPKWADGVAGLTARMSGSIVGNSMGGTRERWAMGRVSRAVDISATEGWRARLGDVRLLREGAWWVYERDKCGMKMAEFMLGFTKNDKFSCHKKIRPPWVVSAYLKGNIGRPTQAMRQIGPNTWRRQFSRGRVQVNFDTDRWSVR